MTDMYANPFFVHVEPALNNYDNKTLYSEYKRMFILCLKESAKIDQNDIITFFNCKTSDEELKANLQHFSLVKTKMRLLQVKNIYSNAIILSKQYLEMIDKNETFDDDEIVSIMLEFKESSVELFSKLNENSTSISNYKKALLMNNYFNSEKPSFMNNQMNNFLMNMKESNFWTNYYNCQIAMTGIFNKRIFSLAKTASKQLTNTIKESNPKEFYDLQGLNTQLECKAIFNSPQKFSDIGTHIQQMTKRTYYAPHTEKLLLTKLDVTNLFMQMTNEKQLYDSFNSLLISKDYCHLVVNNEKVLEKMSSIINEHLPLYKYLFSYAWISLYIDECLFKTKITNTHRSVFDIETANKLPAFPYSYDDIKQSPYLPLLIKKEDIDVENNFMAYGCTQKFENIGIDTLERFLWKLNLFSTGDSNKSIFNGLNWSDKFAISGSIIPALCVKHPNLLNIVSKSTQTQEQKWKAYFDHYYHSSDIDLMCKGTTIKDFLDNISEVTSVIEKNVGSKLTILPQKNSLLQASKQFVSEKLEELKKYTMNDSLTVNDVTSLNNKDSSMIKSYFYEIFIDMKKEKNKEMKQKFGPVESSNRMTWKYCKDFLDLPTIEEFNLQVVDIDHLNKYAFKKDADIFVYNEDNKIYLKTSETIKFKLSSPHMLRTIEAFFVNGDDFFAVVGKFHLPCVRGYYNGKTVFMETSCVSALMTGVNIEYKYFAGIRDPVDILNKYRFRGFGTILNKYELAHTVLYNTSMETMKKVYTNKNSVNGHKNLNNIIYKTSCSTGTNMFLELFGEQYYETENKHIETIEDLKHIYRIKYKYNSEKFGLDMFKFRSIDDEGNVIPLQKWVIEGYWNMNMNQKKY
jgi:hypothetical protein